MRTEYVCVDSLLSEVCPYRRGGENIYVYVYIYICIRIWFLCTMCMSFFWRCTGSRVRASHLRFREHVDGRCLEHHGPLPNLVALSRHDIRQKVVYVLLDESQLKDLLLDDSSSLRK